MIKLTVILILATMAMVFFAIGAIVAWDTLMKEAGDTIKDINDD